MNNQTSQMFLAQIYRLKLLIAQVEYPFFIVHLKLPFCELNSSFLWHLLKHLGLAVSVILRGEVPNECHFLYANGTTFLTKTAFFLAMSLVASQLNRFEAWGGHPPFPKEELQVCHNVFNLISVFKSDSIAGSPANCSQDFSLQLNFPLNSPLHLP